MNSILTPFEISKLANYGVTIKLEGDSLKVSLPDKLLPEAKALLRELKTNEVENVCFLIWQTMFDRCNQAYRPGAIKWAHEHFPELLESLREAESKYQEAFHQQDITGVRQAAASWEEVLKRICLLHRMAEGGEVREAG